MLIKEKSDIIAWLDKYGVENYTLRQDETYGYAVDVAGSVYLALRQLTEISIKFGHVSGDFICSYNQLTSLEGFPVHVEGDFNCASNQLTSLHGSPLEVGGDFHCQDNQLTSLEGGPQHVGGNFFCYDNKLTSLEAMPEVVEGSFHCEDNPKLGELQDMRDFKAIQAYLLAEKLAEKLPYDLNKNNHKIKL